MVQFPYNDSDNSTQVYIEATSNVAPLKNGFISTTFSSAAGSTTVTVPQGELWCINWIMAILVTNATVGNRSYRLEVKDESGNLMFYQTSGANVAASTTRRTLFLSGSVREGSPTDNTIALPIPSELWMKSGWTFTLVDLTAVVASDTLTISYQARKFKGL